MGILVQDTGKQTELQDRITADLREKVQRTSAQSDPDMIEDSEYMKNLKKTGRFGWVWFVLIFLAAAAVVIILII